MASSSAYAWLLVALSAASPTAFALTSTFTTSDEGWTGLGDIAAPLTFESTGGNPGGRVGIPDAVAGGTTYFVAPTTFFGDRSSAIGTNLTFDLQQTYPGSPNQFNDSDVILSGGGLTIAYNTPNNPANGSWTSYAVPLTAAGWTLNDLGGAAVTSAQFSTVLSNLSAFEIRAEFQSGADTDYLDNVTLFTTPAVSPVPEPSTYALMASGLTALFWIRRRKADRY